MLSTHPVGFTAGHAVSPGLQVIPQAGGVPPHVAMPPASGALHTVAQAPQ